MHTPCAVVIPCAWPPSCSPCCSGIDILVACVVFALWWPAHHYRVAFADVVIHWMSIWKASFVHLSHSVVRLGENH